MQRHATKLQNVEPQQIPLIPDEKFTSKPVALDRIYGLKNTFEALEYACELARTPEGRPIQPKQIYSRVGIDKGTWSRICSGEFDLDGRDILQFCSVVANDAYYMYIGHTLNYDLTSFRKVAASTLERENEELRSEVSDLRKALRYVVEAQKGNG